MTFDKRNVTVLAKQLGFVRDAFEKMTRLLDILSDIFADSAMSEVLALKGGTAINLTMFNLPRLSTDIDFDFIGNTAAAELNRVKDRLGAQMAHYMTDNGYTLKTRGSKKTHSLHSFMWSYTNAGGTPDNLKIEVNYSLRRHILPGELRIVNVPEVLKPFEIFSVAPMEIFASKIIALLSRTATRDLYDIMSFLNSSVFSKSDFDTLRKCAVFYAAVTGKPDFNLNNFKVIEKPNYQHFKTQLLPVLRKGDMFDLDRAKKKAREFLTDLLELEPNEREFLALFKKAAYKPELLFEGETLERVRAHPVALWRTRPERAGR
jgi:predicted nucleotidyltransferase component of viral defense system